MAKTMMRKKSKKTMMKAKSSKSTMVKSKVKKMKKAMSKRATVKKVMKKVTKKLVKKITVKKSSATKAKKMAIPGMVGKVVHYYDKIGVAIVEVTAPIVVGDLLTFRRGEREFTQPVSSMQMNHQPVSKAGKGKVIGIKVVQVADPGTLVLHG